MKKVFKKKAKGRKPRVAPFSRQIPSSMNVVLRSRTYETGSSTTPPLDARYGIVEFLGRPGSYSDSLFGLYSYARINGCRITAKVINMGSEPIIMAIAPLPYNWSTGSATTAEILDAPRCVRTTVAGAGGMDKAHLQTQISAAQALGSKVQSLRYQQDSTQASSGTPLFQDEPCWHVWLTSFNTSTPISYRLEIELEFDCQFYNLTSV